MGSKILVIALVAWFAAQAIKVLITLIRDKRFELSKFFESGGMPSSHTSLVIAMTTAVGRFEGFTSTLFAISVVFSLVIMYDATGIRQAAGKQAKILNQMIQDLYRHQYTGSHLKELLGHTPKEVFAGAILGIAIGMLI